MENKNLERIYTLMVYYSFIEERIAKEVVSFYFNVDRQSTASIKDAFIPQRKEGKKEKLMARLFPLELDMPYEQRQDYIIREMAKEGYTPAIYDELLAFITSDDYVVGEEIIASGSFFSISRGGGYVVYYSKDCIFEFQQLGGHNLVFLGVRTCEE
ncbi:MAG: hypothetical protein WCJ39_06185 [bacterium]